MTDIRKPEDLALRRIARARYAAIQARMDERAYREHLAMLEPDEPVFKLADAYEREDSE